MPKLAVPLTENRIEELAPKLNGYKVGDGHDLYLFIRPTGKKCWRMDYKRLGKETSVSLGSYPEVSLSAARQQRDKVHCLLAQGIDPVELKRQRSKQERESKPKVSKPPKLRFSINGDGDLVIEKVNSRITLKLPQVAALKAFLFAMSGEIQGG